MNPKIREIAEYAGIEFRPYIYSDGESPDNVSVCNLENFYQLIIREVFKEIREAGILIPIDYWVGTKEGLILEFQKRLADEIEQKMLKE